MILRNSIRTTLRARRRTLLFTALIVILTLSLTLSLGMYVYSSGTLALMDERYTSMALVEYMDENYPDEDGADPKARSAMDRIDGQALSGIEGVLLWEKTDETLGQMEGYERADGEIPYEGRAIVEATGFYPVNTTNGSTIYSARIVQTLYNQEGRGSMFMVDVGDTDFVPEEGASYLLHGVFAESGTSNPTLSLVDFDTGETAFYKVSGEDDPAFTDSIFTQMARYYANANNYVRITASDAPRALEEFHQGILTLAQGRFPEAGEAGVCVIDGKTAGQMGLTPGDEIHVNLYDSQEDDRFSVSENSVEKTWTVVGITSLSNDWAGRIWVSQGEGGFSQPLFGFCLGMAVLDNGMARQAADQIREMMPEGISVTLYDQGYFSAAQPFEAMKTTALAVAAASACAAFAVLVLFASLFVGRQRETVGILRSLGTPSAKIRLWLISGASLIAAAAAILGAVLGRAFTGGMIRWALGAAQKLYTIDHRYSESAMGTTITPVEMTQMPLWPAFVSALAVFGAALVFCLLFLSQALSRSAPKKGKEKVRIPRGKTSVGGRGVLRYAFVFCRRGGGRSVIVAVASGVLTIFLGILIFVSQGWQSQMDSLYDTSQIFGRATSTNGRQSVNIVINGNNARLLASSGYLKDIGLSLNWHYWFDEDMPPFGRGGFAEETKRNWIARQPTITALNTLLAAPDFFYDDEVAVEWLEGWNEDFLMSDEYYPVDASISYSQSGVGVEWENYPCVVGKNFLDARDLFLGDVFTVYFQMDSFYGARMEVPIDLKVVGACTENDTEDIYVPLAFAISPGYFETDGNSYSGENEVTEAAADMESDGAQAYWNSEGLDYYLCRMTSFSTCRFTLDSARDLDAFRNFLADNGVSQPGILGSNRLTIVLSDQSFVETVGGLGRLISFCGILFPALFGAVCLLGFVISWLMVGSRRMEFAVLRGLGTSGHRVFFIFFVEQALLCLAGSAIGALIVTVTDTPSGWIGAGGFFLCYLAGCALSVILSVRVRLMDLLSEKE